MLSSIGVGEVRVVRRPRVRLVITGNELLPVRLAAARAFASPTPTGRCSPRSSSATAASSTSRASSPTSTDAILEALHAEADVVIVSGGSSVGIEDLAPTLLASTASWPFTASRCARAARPAWAASAHGWCSCCPAIRCRACAPTTSSPAARSARSAGGRGRGRTAPIRGTTGAEDQLADRPARLRARPDRRTARSSRSPSAARRCCPRRRGPTASSSSPPTAKASPPAPTSRSGSMREQEQFLHVLDRDEAERRFRAALDLTPRGIERVPLDAALGRVLAADVVSPVDVPSFDRSNVDGFAVVAEDTFGASEEVPRSVRLADETIHTGVVPDDGRSGRATPSSIATGGMVPRGADAVVMVEHADVQRPASCASAGPSRPAAASRSPAPTSPPAKPCCAAASCSPAATPACWRRSASPTVDVWRQPVVAILSTGDEIIAPGEPMQPATVYDSNAQSSPTPCASSAASRMRLGHRPRRRRRRCGSSCTTRWPAPTSCCSPAARAKAQATSPIASSPS